MMHNPMAYMANQAYRGAANDFWKKVIAPPSSIEIALSGGTLVAAPR